MTRFTNEDFEFTVPDQWIERSVVTFSAPPVMGKLPPNFAIAYDVMPAEEELLKYANRQVDSLRAMLKDWQMIQQSATRISGREALSVLFSWQLPSGKMMQRQSFVRLDARRVVSIGCTATEADFPAADSGWFEAIQNSLRFKV